MGRTEAETLTVCIAERVYGLTHTLSVKAVQDDLVVVENLSLPAADPEYLQDLARSNNAY